MVGPAVKRHQMSMRRAFMETYPSFSFVLHRFWYFVQLPIQIQPAPTATRRTTNPPVYNTNPQRIDLAAEVDNDWAMRTRDGSAGVGGSGSSTNCALYQPNTPQLAPSPDNAASKISLLSLGSSSK